MKSAEHTEYEIIGGADKNDCHINESCKSCDRNYDNNNRKTKGGRKSRQSMLVTHLFVLFDILSIIFSFFIALWFRFDCSFDSIPKNYLDTYWRTIIIYCIISMVVYRIFNLYNSIWKFAGFYEFIRLSTAVVLLGVINVLLTFASIVFTDPGMGGGRMPVSYYIFGTVFQFLFGITVRFSYRTIQLLRKNNKVDVEYIKPVMIYGAGEAGRMLARDIFATKGLGEKVVAFIDDDAEKHGRFVEDIKVFGGRDDVLQVASSLHVKKIYVALPSAPYSEIRDILNICTETSCEVLNLPGMYQLRLGQVKVSQMKEVQIEDLLGREPISINREEVGRFIEGKTVLITGAGGSIGSELSRQCAANNPRMLILFDVYENNVYDIQLELMKRYPQLNLKVLIGSVRDSRRIFQVFEEYRPQIVYHAAAHKHVPLMENSPCESIKNNAIGTYKTAFAAMVHGTERFVLISTDKAVNPTNIMGASKRLCEMIIQTFDFKIKARKSIEIPQLFTHEVISMIDRESIDEALRNAHTEFVAVRFGNVLGSNGSVIPIFKRQIEAGGPVTVTHPDIIRYFMTIPEAVSLVMQAGTYAHGGEIFVLDMGEPMKIDTLARNLIKLSGYIPDVDIKVEYTGLRPGEKLYEEKLMDEEGLEKTANDLIFIGKPLSFDHDAFLDGLDGLMNAAYKNTDSIKEYVSNIVTTYHPY